MKVIGQFDDKGAEEQRVEEVKLIKETEFDDNGPAAVLSKGIAWIAGLAVFAWLAVAAVPWPTFSNVVTVYALYCDGGLTRDKECKGKFKSSVELKFLVNADTQIVVSQIGKLLPEKLEKCVVLDKDNWHCMDGSIVTGFFDGHYYDGLGFRRPVIKPMWLYRRILDGDYSLF